MTDTNSGWFLRHRDGVEHGPFRYADIVAAAKQGNIAEDTCVFHDEKTLGQWVFAQRVEAIAAVIPQTQPAQQKSPRKAATRSARATPRTTARPAAANAANDNLQQAGEAKSEKAESKNSLVENLPVIRPHREQGYPVPKTFFGACMGFIDVRFRSFVTPWIIKILWSLCLAGAILWIGKFAYDAVVTGSGDVKAAATEIEDPGDWQFAPLAAQPWLKTTAMRFIASAGGICIAMLCLRVLCEIAIVLLRAATDLSDAKRLWKEEADK